MDIQTAITEAADLKTTIVDEFNAIESLRASIQDQIDSHLENIKSARSMRTDTAFQVVKDMGIQAFHEVDTAGLIYNALQDADYDTSRDFRNEVNRLFRDIPLVLGNGGTISYPLNAEDKKIWEYTHIDVLHMGVPRNASPDDIREAVDRVTPIIEAQLALKGDLEGNLIIDLLEDSLSEDGSYTILVTTDGYQLVKTTYGFTSDITEVTDLGIVLRVVSEQCSYN